MTAKTYTIAYHDVLLACIPDGGDVHAAVVEECRKADIPVPGDYTVSAGLILTDDPEPELIGDVLWRGQDLGCLTDEAGTCYDYAVRPRV